MRRRGERGDGVEPLGAFGEELERALRGSGHRPTERERSVRARLGRRAALGALALMLVLAGLFVGGGDEAPFQLELPDSGWSSPEPLAQRDGGAAQGAEDGAAGATPGATRPGARPQEPAVPAAGPGVDTATR